MDFVLEGTGANGKSVFVNTLAAAWGDYATHAPIDTFMVTKGDRHPTDLAKLRGARLVIATEVMEASIDYQQLSIFLQGCQGLVI